MYGGGRRGILWEEGEGRGRVRGGGGDNDVDNMDDTNGTDKAGVGNLLPPGGI